MKMALESTHVKEIVSSHKKRVLVCGGGGFIGGPLVKRLKSEGFWVRVCDLKHHEFSSSKADEFIIGDLTDPVVCKEVVKNIDEIYQLAGIWAGLDISLRVIMMPR
jgi:GDP-D-mannose 3',5'-epimerase